jgi:predicted dehydrogenase
VEKLRLGVIGAGSWAVASHLPNFANRRQEVEFVAVARKGKDRLGKIRDDWGFQYASEDYRDVLDAGIDICLVASPSAFHHEHALAALRAGAHVLVEKPVTIDPADAWDLARTADQLERHLVVSFGWNYLPMLRMAKRLMDDQGIGRIEQMMLHMASTTRELLGGTGAYPAASPETVPEPATWNDPALSGGGYAQAQLTHALGIALWLTPLRATEVFAFMSAPHGEPVEIHDAIAVRFAGDAVGTIDGGSAHVNAGGNKHQVELRLIGSEGQFHLDLEREVLWLFRRPDIDVRPQLDSDAGLYNCDGPPNALIDLAQGKDVDNCSPGWLGARTVEVLAACYQSAQRGTPVRVTTEPDYDLESKHA